MCFCTGGENVTKKYGEPTEFAEMEAELNKLRRKNAELIDSAGYAAKSNGLIRKPANERYKFIKRHDEYAVAKRAPVLQVSKSGYYSCLSALVKAEKCIRGRSLTNNRGARGSGYPNLLKREYLVVPRMGLSSDFTYLKSG